MKDNDYIYGFHAISARVRQSPETVNCVYTQLNRKDARSQKLISLLKSHGIKHHPVSKDEIKRYVGNVVHQGVVADINSSKQVPQTDFSSALSDVSHNEIILILDSIQDPANLGACIRTADAAGVKHIIIPKDKSASVTSLVRKVAAGATENISIHTVTNLVRELEKLKQHGFWVVGLADESSQSLYDYKFDRPIAVVLGNEAKGLRKLTREHCDELLSIPMRGQVESLNVSVATGITLFEIVRQKNAQ